MNRQKERDGMEERTESGGYTPYCSAPNAYVHMPYKKGKQEQRPSPTYKADDGWVVDSRFGHLIGS